MSERYLVNVKHDQKHHISSLIETCDIVVQTLYNAHKAEILALAKDLRSTVDAFWLQMTNKETWRPKTAFEQIQVKLLINEHVRKAVDKTNKMIEKTDNLIETVKKAACSCKTMQQQCREVQKKAPGETMVQSPMKQWYNQVWIDVRRELCMQFRESFEQHVGRVDPDAELPFLVGALQEQIDEFFHYMDVLRKLEERCRKLIKRRRKLIGSNN